MEEKEEVKEAAEEREEGEIGLAWKGEVRSDRKVRRGAIVCRGNEDVGVISLSLLFHVYDHTVRSR